MTTETNLKRLERCLREEEEKLKVEISRLPIIKVENAELHEKLRKSEDLLRRNETQLDEANKEVRRLREVLKLVGSDICSDEDREFVVENALKGELE